MFPQGVFCLVCMNWHKYSQGMKFWLLLLQYLSNLLSLYCPVDKVKCCKYIRFVYKIRFYRVFQLSTVSADINGNTMFCVKLRNFYSWLSIVSFTLALTFFLIKLEMIYWSITFNVEHTSKLIFFNAFSSL